MHSLHLAIKVELVLYSQIAEGLTKTVKEVLLTVTAVITAVLQWSIPDKAEMHSQGAVDARAVNAQEHAIRDTGPARVFGCAVKTYLDTKVM